MCKIKKIEILFQIKLLIIKTKISNYQVIKLSSKNVNCRFT